MFVDTCNSVCIRRFIVFLFVFVYQFMCICHYSVSQSNKHSLIHPSLHKMFCTESFIHLLIHSFSQSVNRLVIHSFIFSFRQSAIHLSIFPFIQSVSQLVSNVFIHIFSQFIIIHSFVHPLVYLFSHSLLGLVN